MQHMRKIEVIRGKFILYNGSFFIKSCKEHIVWTTNRADAMVMSEREADEILDKNNQFLRSGGR